jgi:hypothetical protein
MGAQVIDDHERHVALGARPGDSGPYLGTKNVGRPAWGQSAIEPARAPVDEPKAIDLLIGPGRLDEALAASAFATPDPGEGGMKRQLDLILERDVSVRQEAQQLVHVGRHVLQKIGITQGSHGWRGRRAGPGEDHLHPQAFPT